MTEYYNITDNIFLQAITNSMVYPMIKVELLDYFENAYDEITQDISRDEAGSININYQQGVRRTCEITLINNFKKYNPHPNGRIWFNTKFKVYTGFKIFKTNKKQNYLYLDLSKQNPLAYQAQKEETDFLFATSKENTEVDYDIYWFAQGVFVLTDPTILEDRSNKTITLNGVDKFGLLGGETNFHELEGTYIVPAGTTVEKCITDTLALSIGNSQDYPLDPIPPFIDSTIIDWTYGFISSGEEGLYGNFFIIDSCEENSSNNLEVYVNDVLLNKNQYTYYPTTGELELNFIPSEGADILIILKLPIGSLTLPYDIEKSPNEFYSDIFIELGNVFSCDIFYDVNGVLNFIRGNQKKDFDSLTSEWNFSNKSNNYFSPELSVDFTNMYNVIKVVGTSDSAVEVCDYTIVNDDLSSPTCVQLVGKKIKYVESSFCFNQARTRDFAKYLMKKYSMIQETLNFSACMLPQLDVNKIITITDDYFEWTEERFIIQSITIPLTSSDSMEIEATNVAHIPFYEY